MPPFYDELSNAANQMKTQILVYILGIPRDEIKDWSP